MKSYKKSLMIFRRDLRAFDNTALNAALSESEAVIPCFIYDPRQVGDENAYKSDNAVQFMVESLDDLDKQLKKKNGKLYRFYGEAPDILSKVIKNNGVDAVFVNKDYTPFSIKRDKKLEQVCKDAGIPFKSFEDALLHPPEDTLKANGQPYTVFTPFWKNASKSAPAKPTTKSGNYVAGTVKAPGVLQGAAAERKVAYNPNDQIFRKGGRAACAKILKKLSQFDNYSKERDFPAIDGTTGLSPHNKFGTYSIREVYQALANKLGRNNPLLRQLYWRDFYTQIAYFFPHVFGQAFDQRYKDLKWSSSTKLFNVWCKGETGFPIVDAGMRQLNETGWMHNRVRMIAASLLTKDFHIDWRKGEKYFAQQLVDYDPAVNNGNWQWVASTGCDKQPYFRIFNPWLQQKKFDPDCEYIKRWVPELKDVPCKDIHAWDRVHQEYDGDYPAPRVDHSVERDETLRLFKQV